MNRVNGQFYKYTFSYFRRFELNLNFVEGDYQALTIFYNKHGYYN